MEISDYQTFQPSSYMQEQGASMYSKESVFNMSFQHSYNPGYACTNITCDMTLPQYGGHGAVGEDYSHGEHGGEYHGYHDMSGDNDSGVTSEDSEHYNVDTDRNYNAAYDIPNQVTATNKSEKPLSAWKAKQLKLSAAGVIKRRRDANKRERKRMNGLNEAFERLREHVPGVTKQTNKKLSKMDTLQMANLYIRHLASLLNLEQDPTPQ